MKKQSAFNFAQKLGLYFATIFFSLLILPIFMQWADMSGTLYDYVLWAKFLSGKSENEQYYMLAGIAGISIITAFVFAFSLAKFRLHAQLYYFVRVMVRYRLALAMLGFGLIKIFPMQQPFPSLSNLHTNYGDFLPWKIYFHTVGITPKYEIFFGIIEILAGVLLLFRRTTTFGAGIALGFMANVFAANIAYKIGQGPLALSLILMALFLFANDFLRLFNLLILEKPTRAENFEPQYSGNFTPVLAGVLKSVFVFIFCVYAFLTYQNYQNAPYKIPTNAALKNTYGFYNVKEFKLNGQTLPYSDTDQRRWQNVIFEKWATMTIKTAEKIKIDSSKAELYSKADLERNYESAGVADRKYFDYQADTSKNTLVLKNKNPNYASESFRLKYTFLPNNNILLEGENEKNEHIYALLEKINKKYMLLEGRRKPVKL